MQLERALLKDEHDTGPSVECQGRPYFKILISPQSFHVYPHRTLTSSAQSASNNAFHTLVPPTAGMGSTCARTGVWTELDNCRASRMRCMYNRERLDSESTDKLLQQSCFAIAVKESSCTPTVTGCICTDQQLQSNMQVCVTQTCTRREALTTKNITSTLCHEPKRNAGNSIRVLNAVLAAMTAMFAVPRLIYRAVYATEELGWDDYSVVVTLFAGLPSVIST